MLSDIGEATTDFGVSLGYSYTDSGESTYNTVNLGLRYRVIDWLQVTANIPYVDIRAREELSPGYALRYSDAGIGDVSVVGWLDLAHLLLHEEEEMIDEGDAEPLEGIGDPRIYLGLGVKLATGNHSERDIDRYYYDRGLAQFTGEYSKSDGAVPAYYQVGSGTTDPLVSLVYQQNFGRFVPTVGVSYQYIFEENSLDYERGDRFSWNLGTKYIISRMDECRTFYVRGGIASLVVVEADMDHSEDTTLLGSQEKGKVPATKGTYNFWDMGIGYDLTENITVHGGASFPLGSHNSDGDNSFDHQINLTLLYRF
jgi:hypothetical protein